jgi:hypothetical protein
MADRTVGTVRIRVVPDFGDFNGLLKQGLGANMAQANVNMAGAKSAMSSPSSARGAKVEQSMPLLFRHDLMEARRTGGIHGEIAMLRDRYKQALNEDKTGRAVKIGTMLQGAEKKRDDYDFRRFLAEEKAASKELADAKKLEAAAHRDAARAARSVSRLSDAQFSASLSGMSPTRQLAAIRDRQAGMIPGSLDHARLERQAGSLGRKTGMNREVLGMGNYMSAMFGGWEIAGSGMAGLRARRDSALTNDSREQYDIWQKATERQQGGIFGSMIGFGVEGMDALVGMMPGKVGSSRWERYFSPGAASALVRSADQQDATGKMKLSGMEAVNAMQRAASIVAAGDGFTGQIKAAEVAFTNAEESAKKRRNELTSVPGRTAADIAAAHKNYASEVKAAKEIKDIEIHKLKSAEARTVIGMDNTATAFREHADGMTPEVVRKQIERRQALEMGELRQRNDKALVAAKAKVDAAELFDFDSTEALRRSMNSTLAMGQFEAMQMLHQRRPLEAQLKQIDARRRAATMNPSLTKDERAEIELLADSEGALARQARSDQIESANIGLNSRKNILDAMKARNPFGAEMQSTLGRGASEYDQLMDAGMETQAAKSMANTKSELELQRQEYLEGFRARSVDLRSMNISNVRDQEDPGVILKSVKDSIDNLPAKFKELLAD